MRSPDWVNPRKLGNLGKSESQVWAEASLAVMEKYALKRVRFSEIDDQTSRHLHTPHGGRARSRKVDLGGGGAHYPTVTPQHMRGRSGRRFREGKKTSIFTASKEHYNMQLKDTCCRKRMKAIQQGGKAEALAGNPKMQSLAFNCPDGLAGSSLGRQVIRTGVMGSRRFDASTRTFNLKCVCFSFKMHNGSYFH